MKVPLFQYITEAEGLLAPQTKKHVFGYSSAVSLKLNSTKPTPLGDPSVGNHRLLRFKTTASAVKPSRWSLHGSTALVTGGTRGIGHAIVEELAWLGATVHTCVRNEDELEKYLRAWEDEGLGVTGSVCDVSSQADRGKLLDSISSVFDGKLNILINNVGTNIRQPMVDFASEEVLMLVGTNFESAFHMCQLAYPLLKASGAGNVVFTSSVSGFVSLNYMSVHGASKGAINQLTKNLACEWVRDSIRVNAVAPWYIRTSMVEQVGFVFLFPFFLVCIIFL